MKDDFLGIFRDLDDGKENGNYNIGFRDLGFRARSLPGDFLGILGTLNVLRIYESRVSS